MIKLIARVLLASLALVGSAIAQSPPAPIMYYGFVPTADQWNNYFRQKQDALGYTPVNRAGDVMTGRLVTAPPTTSGAMFNLTPGTAPTSPKPGDMWAASGGLYYQNGGTTVGPIVGSASLAGTAPISVTTAAGTTTFALLYGTEFTLSGSNLALASSLTFTGKTITGGTYVSPSLTTPNIGVATGTSLSVTGSMVAGSSGPGNSYYYFGNNTGSGNLPAMGVNNSDNTLYVYSRGAGGISFQSAANAQIATLSDAGLFAAKGINPYAASTYNLGSSSLRWATVFANSFTTNDGTNNWTWGGTSELLFSWDGANRIGFPSASGVKLYGSTSGAGTLSPPAVASTYAWALPAASGTVAVSATAPLVLNSTTGNLTCTSCSAASLQEQYFSTAGANTFTAPSNAASTTVYKISLYGAGGGAGGHDSSANNAGGAGGGGGALAVYYTTLTPGTGYTITIGTGGGGGNTSGTNGTAGGNTTIVVGATTVTAGGGAGGGGAVSSSPISTAAAGGTATNGTINVPGNPGGWGAAVLHSGGGTAIVQGGAGGAAPGRSGVAGAYLTTGAATGNNGGSCGSGGGGGAGVNAAAAGGTGANGCALVEWVQ